MDNAIVLLVGKSGSGKTSVCNELEKRFNWKQLESYTTRKPRYKDEIGHTFITEDEFDLLKHICAYTVFDGHRYCATQEQIDNADVYVVDPIGVTHLQDLYIGNKLLIPIYLDVSEETAYQRMRKRGDSFLSAKKRLKHDREAFREFEKNAPIRINAEQDLDIVVSHIYKTAKMMSDMHKLTTDKEVKGVMS